MKFTVLKSVFMNVMTPAMGTVSNKNTITSIEGVLIETLEDGRVRLSTYDMNKGIRATFEPSSIEEEGKYIINAQRLYQTIKVLPEDEFTLEVNEKLNCNIYCGKSKFSMFAMNGSEFPNLPDLTSESGFEISSSSLRNIIGKISHSVAVQDNRIMLTGAFFNISDGAVEVVSCDNFTLSKCKIKCDVNSKSTDGSDKFKFIIPGYSLSEIIKILPQDDEYKCTIYLSRKHAIIQCDDITFFTRTIDSEYIDYNRIIPKDNDIKVIVDRERMLLGLERASIIADEKVQGNGRSYVKLTIEEGSLLITSASVSGNVEDEMDCTHDGRDIEIGFNCRYLINSIKVAEGENIKITLKTPLNAITIEPCEEDENYSYFYMILPRKMNEQ